MELSENRLRKIVREEIIKERKRTVARGEDGGHVKLQVDDDTGLILMDVASGRRGGETRVKLLPGEAENLAQNLRRMQ
jgi:hypothetical protein